MFRTLLSILFAATVACAQSRDFQSADLLKLRSVGDVQWSPDSTRIAYTVGDSFGIFPTNDPALVEAVIMALDAPPDFPIGGRTLCEVLTDGVSLAPAPDMLFQLYSYLTGGARRVIAQSIAFAYAPGPRGTVHIESDPLLPDAQAPKAFRRSAAALRDLESCVLGAGGVVMRYGYFYGPGSAFSRAGTTGEDVRRRRFPIVGDGLNRRSMVFVDNLCQGLMLAEKTPAATGRCYWIADRRPYTMNEIVDTVARVMERDFKMKVSHRRPRLPAAVADAARLADGLLQQIGLYNSKLHVLSEMSLDIACSVERAIRELGYNPEIELEEGMRRSVSWAVSKGQLG